MAKGLGLLSVLVLLENFYHACIGSLQTRRRLPRQ